MKNLENISAFNLWMALSLILLIRYFLFAGIPYLWLYIWKNKYPYFKKIQQGFPSQTQIKNEILYSLLTFGIYSLGIYLYVFLIDMDTTQYYSNIEELGITYFILSILMMIFLHDAYFYWTHRLIHHKKVFKIIHHTHHKFRSPSPWAAFAFHPLEAIISMGIIPIIVFFIPWHHFALIIFLSFMTIYDVFIHLGFDVKLGFWQVSPIFHDKHHQVSRGNYGLYFTFWDRLMGTSMNKEDNLVS